MNHFTSIKDIEDPQQLVKKALEFKADPFQPHLAKGKKMGLIFLNSSLRTRLSTQLAARNLGAEAIVLDIGSEGWALELDEGVIMDGQKAEHVREAAGVLGQYFDLIGVRTFPSLLDREKDYAEEWLEAFKKYSGKPILSLESATLHPLQSLADWMTMAENWQKSDMPKVVLTWAPHVKALPQAVPNSFLEWMKAAEVDLTLTHPEGYELAPAFAEGVRVEYDQQKALADADFVYVKNWSAYQDYGQVLSRNESWTFDDAHLKLTNDAKIMHCLPVRRGLVIADEILDGPNALHLQQANNRIYSAQAVISELLEI